MGLSIDLIERGRTATSDTERCIIVRNFAGLEVIPREEWDRRFPGVEPFTSVVAAEMDQSVFEGSTTHNLTEMAREAGVYLAMWRPEDIGATTAKDIVDALAKGIAAMEADPDRFKAFNAPNGWGTYDDFLELLKKYHQACTEHPDAIIEVGR